MTCRCWIRYIAGAYNQQVKTLLGYLALVVVVLAVANFVWLAATGVAAVPMYVSHPLGIVAAFYLLFVFVVPTMLGRQVPRALPPAGPPIATFRAGGRLGRVGYSSSLTAVTVYADRLTLKPLFLGEYTIHGSDIRSVTDLGGMMFRRVRIEHAGPGLFTRITLTRVPDDARAMIARISRDPLPPGRPAPARARAAQAANRRFMNVLFTVTCLTGLGLTTVGIVAAARYHEPIMLVWAVFMLVGTFVVGRDFVKFRRRA